MMKPLRIKRLTLGDGHPKIAVSIVAKKLTNLDRQLRRIVTVKPDLVEWRIDALDQFPDRSTVKTWLEKIHARLAELPLIATFRTLKEGGNMKASEDQYFRLLSFLSASSWVDVLDVELEHDQGQVSAVVHRAHQHGIKIIMSNHDFQKVPANLVIIDRMNMMQRLHADIAKVAVMPRSKADVLRFMRTSFKADRSLKIPVVTMAMGELGKLTRVCGSLTGSVITFGSLSQTVSSAAGQIPVATLRQVLKLFNKQ